MKYLSKWHIITTIAMAESVLSVKYKMDDRGVGIWFRPGVQLDPSATVAVPIRQSNKLPMQLL
jgi:hypothetical protein